MVFSKQLDVECTGEILDIRRVLWRGEDSNWYPIFLRGLLNEGEDWSFHGLGILDVYSQEKQHIICDILYRLGKVQRDLLYSSITHIANIEILDEIGREKWNEVVTTLASYSEETLWQFKKILSQDYSRDRVKKAIKIFENRADRGSVKREKRDVEKGRENTKQMASKLLDTMMAYVSMIDKKVQVNLYFTCMSIQRSAQYVWLLFKELDKLSAEEVEQHISKLSAEELGGYLLDLSANTQKDLCEFFKLKSLWDVEVQGEDGVIFTSMCRLFEAQIGRTNTLQTALSYIGVPTLKTKITEAYRDYLTHQGRKLLALCYSKYRSKNIVLGLYLVEWLKDSLNVEVAELQNYVQGAEIMPNEVNLGIYMQSMRHRTVYELE